MRSISSARDFHIYGSVLHGADRSLPKMVGFCVPVATVRCYRCVLLSVGHQFRDASTRPPLLSSIWERCGR